MIDYLLEKTCMYACAVLCFYCVKFHVLVYYDDNYCKVAHLWCSVKDMRLSKCSIIIVTTNTATDVATNYHKYIKTQNAQHDKLE